MADNLNKKPEGEAKEIAVQRWGMFKRTPSLGFPFRKIDRKKDLPRKIMAMVRMREEEQRIFLGVNEKQSKCFQSVLHDQERKTSHSEISVEGMGASNRDPTACRVKTLQLMTRSIRADSCFIYQGQI